MAKIILAVCSLLLVFASPCVAQTIIKGRVVDMVTKEPLESALITDAATLKTTITNNQGEFVLKNVMDADSVTISLIGYSTQKVTAGAAKDNIIIELRKGQVDLKEIIITSYTNNITTSRTLSSIDLGMQPVKSAQDLLRLVPGLFIAQHQGGGKAEQIFLRGFDADHGTDVNVSVDGLPVNMVSHAHGQGYSDLHFLIPETVAGYDFGKGPYYTDKGDFCTAGYVAYNTMNVLDKNMVKIEGGQFNTGRIVTMLNLLDENAKTKGQSAYIAAEGLYSDGGPFQLPEHFRRLNLFGKFITKLDANNKLTVILSTLNSTWRASGELPNRALAEGYVTSRFGAIDSSQGGYTSRTNAIAKLTTTLGHNFTWENEAFYSHYNFNLISNFTFYYADPLNGDEFGQHEERDMYGYKTTITRENYLGSATLTSTAGAGIRYDNTYPTWLSHTLHANDILNFIQLGTVKECNSNAYIDQTLTLGKWLFNTGARFDYFNFYYLNNAPKSDSAAAIYDGKNPSQGKSIISPKLNVQYTVNPKWQLYVKMGKGFHSNDARVVIANQGYQVLPPAYGADFGINWKPAPRLFINTALWYLYLRQEFTYGQDFGDESVQPSGRTVRKGIDFSARYQVNDWLFANLNIDLAVPKAIDSTAGHNYLALAPTFTSTAGLFFRFNNGLNGGISYRYLRNRAANSTYSLTALGYFVTDLAVNYTKKNYEIGFTVQNLLNVAWDESQFDYISRLKYEKSPVDEVSYTPGAPFFAKLKFSVFF